MSEAQKYFFFFILCPPRYSIVRFLFPSPILFPFSKLEVQVRRCIKQWKFNSYRHKNVTLGNTVEAGEQVSAVSACLHPPSLSLSLCSGVFLSSRSGRIPCDAWEAQRQQNEEKVGESGNESGRKGGSDREREFPVWVKLWSDTAIFRRRHARLWDWKVNPPPPV